MERQKAPRANRSKKTLPAAFCNHEAHLVSPAPLTGGGAEVSASAAALGGGGSAVGTGAAAASAVVATGGDRSNGPDGPLPPSLQPPPIFPDGWAGAAGGEAAREGIRLDALVFLSSCPQRHGHSAMKKMMHPPTLELFCLVEIPGAEHQRNQLRASLQDWLGHWCALQAEHPDLLVAVREAFWDAPQGYPMGILCEYMPLGSLDELIQACGGLPEEAMREVAQVVLEALDSLHSAQPPVVHGCLKPSQVLFSANGSPRLTFGLEQRLKGSQVWSLPSPHGAGAVGASQDALEGGAGGARGFDGGVAGPRTPGTPHGEQSPAVDIFDLGLLLLVSALGGLDVLLDAIPYAREFGASQSARGPRAPMSAVSPDTCALLQHELREPASAQEASGAAVSGGAAADMGYLPPASDLLFNRRYSGPFLAFVSTCLEAHTQRLPVSASDLLQHEFLRAQAPIGPLVSLCEMQEMARMLNEAPEHDPSRFGPAKGGRAVVPGVVPSVAQSAQLYLMNIAQSIAPHCGAGGGVHNGPMLGDFEAVMSQPEWDTLLTDTARTLGLSRAVVQALLKAQLERLLERRARSDAAM
mmetsp:Transcript_87236/g.187072  ORF Transcript_87236/g.187072 Transcript_87236/m.187072 type:complete len:583 (-) Transcript_87236:9-1757(-)